MALLHTANTCWPHRTEWKHMNSLVNRHYLKTHTNTYISNNINWGPQCNYYSITTEAALGNHTLSFQTTPSKTIIKKMIPLCDHFWPLDESKSHCLVTDYRSVEASEVVMVIAPRLSAPINHLPLNKGFPILCFSQKLHFSGIKLKHQHWNLLLLFLLPK